MYESEVLQITVKIYYAFIIPLNCFTYKLSNGTAHKVKIKLPTGRHEEQPFTLLVSLGFAKAKEGARERRPWYSDGFVYHGMTDMTLLTRLGTVNRKESNSAQVQLHWPWLIWTTEHGYKICRDKG